MYICKIDPFVIVFMSHMVMLLNAYEHSIV